MLARVRPHLALIIHVALTTAVALAAMRTQNNILFWILGVLLTGLLLSMIVSHLMIRSVEVQRLDPRHGAVGEPLIVRYRVTNRRRWLPVFNLAIEERLHNGAANWMQYMAPARAWVMHVAPGETVHGEAIYWPRARGEVRFARLRVYTTFPFGLLRRTRTFEQSTHTLVYPRRYRLQPRVLRAIVPSGPLGMKLSHRSGGGDDFFGVREYQSGDSRRSIAWKRSASASNGNLLVVERTLPSPPRLRFVLDLTLPRDVLRQRMGEGHDPRVLEERAISLAASLVDEANVLGFEIGLSIIGVDAPVTPIRRSHWHVERLLGALAALDLDVATARDHRSPRASADAERASVVVIHPGPVNPGLVTPDAWHFSAMQMDRLLDDPESMRVEPPVMPTSGGSA